MKALTAVDLFAGAGGLSEGFRQAGFDIRVSSDFDPEAAETFRHNHPETDFLELPIEELKTDDILALAGVRRGELDVLLGGPPCQAFSVYNHQRGMHDERSGLFRQYLRLVEELLPRFVVMENVTGITSIADGHAVAEIHSKLKKLGYTVEHRILKAEEFGVPQERRRIFFLGSRESGSIRWPLATHSSPLGLQWPGQVPFVNVRDAIGDLPALGLCEGDEVTAYPRQPASSEYQRMMRAGATRLFNHVAPALGTINIQRLQYIPQGGSWRDIPESLLPAGMKRAKRSDHTKRYGRLHPEGLSSTILTKCDLHWGAYIHPDQDRTLTVREAARFQSFPDRIRFMGSRGGQFRQVGNAVPPLLAMAVAESVWEMLEGAKTSNRKQLSR